MSSQKWIVFLLFTDRRSIHMSRQDFRLIRQRQKLILDAPHKIRHTAALKIRPSNRMVEQCVATEQNPFRRNIIADSPRCMVQV